ncbi:MAG: ATP-binding protein [Alphaproteobacteria bacterium]|nr:ATP-binding protein [Alphaproteobacteria bacterium]
MSKTAALELLERFASHCNSTVPQSTIVDKAGEQFLAIHVGAINDLYTEALSVVRNELAGTNEYAERVFLKPITPKPWLQSLEVQLLQRVFSESLTVGKGTLDSRFHEKFIPFLGGEERRIYSAANHVVFGRRGAGKSSLVLYACSQAKRESKPYSWIALQQYRGRIDLQVIPQVLYEIVDSVSKYTPVDESGIERLKSIIYRLESKFDNLTKQDINTILPIFARDFLAFVQKHGQFYIFLDDLHLLHPSLQPYFLSALYAFSRGNNVYLKITAIENLTTLMNEVANEGLQTPGDAQVIRLDYNLLDPGAALAHLQQILGSYTKYVGIPSLSSIAENKVIERLAWVSAGVPRDALYIFNNAITKAKAARRKNVAITDINMAAADSLTEKERYVSDDVVEDSTLMMSIVNDIKDFCLNDIHSNAFLVRLDSSDPLYRLIKKVSELRFIHVLHPGITPAKAGEKYEAYMLDYAFYTGFRKAPSVKEFQERPTQPTAKDLRKLKRYPYGQRLKRD